MESTIPPHAPASPCDRATRKLALLVAAVAVYLALVVPIFAQEAYYWTYAQHLDLSYFDHPPMVAWLIWVGTAILGDGALGVRLGTVLCGLGASWASVALLRRFGGDGPAVRIWLIASLAVPMLTITRFFATPDAPLMFGWMGAMYAVWRARETGALRWWLLGGALAGFGLLAKYAAAFLAVGGVLVMLVDERLRRQWFKPGPWLGVVTAAIVFSPVVVWNARNGFESFLFQTDGRYSRGEFDAGRLAGTLGVQSALYHPLLALLLVLVVPWLVRRAVAGDVRARFLLAFGVPMPAFFLANSLWITIKPNWFVPAFPSLLLGTVLWWRESGVAERFARSFTIARRIVIASAGLLLLAPVVHLVPIGAGSSAVGWDQVADRAEHWGQSIDAEDGVPGNVFFFCSDYRDAAQLGRNLRIEHDRRDPRQTLSPTLAQNVLGRPSLQFDHWDQPAARTGQDAIFVLPRADQRQLQIDEASARFGSIEKRERVVVERFGVRLYYADVFVCRGYRGPDPGG
ncbi:MAG: glycosyltransferase family 39 protein [Planctomycetes bacterium]|nr:glycosyltransferase family 39 protein [Planctomycetota bacterium]